MVSTLQPRGGDVFPDPQPVDVMSIDCHTCAARFSACSDCVVAVLLPEAPGTVPSLDADERLALDILSDSGLVPPLRYRPTTG